jgi:hypothetical protein
MQITVEIPDELATQAAARGMTPESYVRRLVDDAVRTAPLPLPPAKGKRDMAAFFKAMAENSENIPVLPDEALTREGIYQDHD